MILLPPAIRLALTANGLTAHILADRNQRFDPVPVLRLFNPLGAATWLATELAEDGDSLFGLADLGFGCPELGTFSLREIASVRLPFGLSIERDLSFASLHPLSVWADTARRTGSILMAEAELRNAAAAPLSETSSPPEPDRDE